MFATEKGRREIRRHHPLPDFQRRVECRVVVLIIQPGIVLEDVDPTEITLDERKQLLDIFLLGELGPKRVVADRMIATVDPHYRGALAGEPVSDSLAERARRAGDDAHSPL